MKHPRSGFWLILTVGLLLRILTGYFNTGFVALDDYSDILLSSVPAQDVPPLKDVMAGSGIRSPIPKASIYLIAQLGLHLGIDHPVNQVRFVYIFLGIFSLISLLFVWRVFSNRERHVEAMIASGLVAAHFLMPFLSTRTLIEGMAAPFLMGSAWFLDCFNRRGRSRDAALSVALLAGASIFRFQAGICLLIVGFYLLRRFQWKATAAALISGVVCFFLTGWVDAVFKGGFHQSLHGYVDYNVHHSSSYGTSPFYVYLLLFLGLSIPPFFLSRYRNMKFSDSYRGFGMYFGYFAIFVLSHSLVPHKEPRFMTTVLPLFFVLLAPLLSYFVHQPSQRVRVGLFAGVNLILLFLTSFYTAQNNIVSLAQFIDRNPSIQQVYNVNQSVTLIPSTHRRSHPAIVDIDAALVTQLDMNQCHQVIAVRADELPHVGLPKDRLKEVARFQPGPLESLIIKLVPHHNMRRNTIHLFSENHCVF